MIRDVLFCDEIFVEILEYLSPGEFRWESWQRWKNEKALKTYRDSQRALVSCALTCRAFLEPALTRLWRLLDHPVFLLKVLPWHTGNDSSDAILVRVSYIDIISYLTSVRRNWSPISTSRSGSDSDGMRDTCTKFNTGSYPPSSPSTEMSGPCSLGG